MTYQATLAQARRVGSAHADDAQLAALFCAGPLQTLVGAVSPRLVWEGAQRAEITARELGKMCARDPQSVETLMWL